MNFTHGQLLTKNENEMETNLEQKNLNEDEKIEVNEKFESIVQESMNEIMGSMFQLFSVHDIIMGGMKNINKDFIKRSISSEKYVLSTEMFDILEKIQTYNFSDNQRAFLEEITNQERIAIYMFDEEYKKIV